LALCWDYLKQSFSVGGLVATSKAWLFSIANQNVQSFIRDSVTTGEKGVSDGADH
jgi:hypothetical protein